MKILFSIVFILTASVLFAQKQTSFTVNFDFNRSEITPAAAAKLDSFVNFIVASKSSFTIGLAGHTDSVGSNEYNDALSLRRTGAVKQYLDAKGLESSNVFTEEGLGKRQPLNKNITGNDRYLNRRVVVNITIPGRSFVKVPEKTPPVVDTPVKVPPVEKTISEIIKDTATKTGMKFAIHNLNFIGGRHYLVPGSIPVIEELITVMNNNPRLEIAIEGHVCCIPGINDDGIDLDLGTANLSEMRAKTVYDYLIRKGISQKRLSYKGFGHQFPIYPYPEKSTQEADENRRVEIKITNM